MSLPIINFTKVLDEITNEIRDAEAALIANAYIVQGKITLIDEDEFLSWELYKKNPNQKGRGRWRIVYIHKGKGIHKPLLETKLETRAKFTKMISVLVQELNSINLAAIDELSIETEINQQLQNIEENENIEVKNEKYENNK